MRDWIITVALYVLGLGFFAFLGGIGAAADAFRRWGELSSSIRSHPGSSS